MTRGYLPVGSRMATIDFTDNRSRNAGRRNESFPTAVEEPTIKKELLRSAVGGSNPNGIESRRGAAPRRSISWGEFARLSQ